MKWLKELLARIFSTEVDKEIKDLIIIYDDADMIIYKKSVK